MADGKIFVLNYREQFDRAGAQFVISNMVAEEDKPCIVIIDSDC